jgi:hypothetical protein
VCNARPIGCRTTDIWDDDRSRDRAVIFRVQVTYELPSEISQRTVAIGVCR